MSPCKKAIIPQMQKRIKRAITPQIRIFLVFVTSVSLPVDRINRPTPKTKTKKATIAISGMSFKPMSENPSTAVLILVHMLLKLGNSAFDGSCQEFGPEQNSRAYNCVKQSIVSFLYPSRVASGSHIKEAGIHNHEHSYD